MIDWKEFLDYLKELAEDGKVHNYIMWHRITKEKPEWTKEDCARVLRFLHQSGRIQIDQNFNVVIK